MDLPAEPDPLTQPTRRRLFETLQGLRRAAGTDELAAAVGMHVNGVRRHLERMQAAGLVERRRSRHGRGRPRDEWSIAAGAEPGGARPESYAEVSRWLVRAIAAKPDLDLIERTGREVGLELAPDTPDAAAEPADSFAQTFSSLGFQPVVEARAGGGFTCKLCNCPYRASAGENPEVICTLHRGITVGVLERLDPAAELGRFVPNDPDVAGCLVEVERPGPAAG